MDNFWQGFDKQAGLFGALKKGLKSMAGAKRGAKWEPNIKPKDFPGKRSARWQPSVGQEGLKAGVMGGSKVQRNITFANVPNRIKSYSDL